MEIETYEEIVPTRVQAVRLTKDNMRTVAKWCHGDTWTTLESIAVPTARGKLNPVCEIGQYVVKSSAGDFSIMDPHAFAMKYRKVEPPVVKQVPLVHYKDGERIVIGTADVKPDGSISAQLNDAVFINDLGFEKFRGGVDFSFGPGRTYVEEELSLVMKPEDYLDGK